MIILSADRGNTDITKFDCEITFILSYFLKTAVWHCTLHNIYLVLYIAHCKLYAAHCVLYTVHSTLYAVHCTVLSVL